MTTFGLRVGIELVSYSDTFLDGAEPLGSAVLACRSDRACVARRLRAAGVDVCFRATVNLAIDPPLVTLDLIDAASERLLASRVEEGERGRPMETQLAKATEQVLDAGGLAKGGLLSVTLSPPDARLTVMRCGDRACKEAEPFPLQHPSEVIPSGWYRVRAELEGFDRRSLLVDVQEGRDVRVGLALPSAVQEESFSLAESPWFWAAVGGAVALAGATIAVMASGALSAPERTGCVCITTSNHDCPPCP